MTLRAALVELVLYNMTHKFMRNANVGQKRQWLIKKGYESARTADNNYINQLFDLHVPAWFREAEKQKKNKKNSKTKDWKMWQETNRPHHLGGNHDRRRNLI